MVKSYLLCPICSYELPTDVCTLSCVKCSSPLIVCYPKQSDLKEKIRLYQSTIPKTPAPVSGNDYFVSFGEGNTPLVLLGNLSALLGIRRLYAKLEFINPTGSFKDRGASTLMSMVRQVGITELVEDSSGNAGASIAAYAAKCGIKAHIFAPEGTSEAKIRQIKIYGAETHLIPGTRNSAAKAAIDFCARNDLVYASHNLSPYFLEGTKTFAYELARDFPLKLPDHIVFPVGNGSLFLGTWLGLNELKSIGDLTLLPKLHAVQSEVVMPIAAMYANIRWSQIQGSRTVAGGISVDKPPRLHQVVETLRESGGTSVSVSDTEIIEWQVLLAEKEGIFCEPTSAAAAAGVSKLIKCGIIKREESVMVPVTGSGLKDT